MADVGRAYRGHAWSGGGATGSLTLPNILRRFAPGLRGAAAGADAAGFNLAVPGAEHDSLVRQAAALLRQLRDHPDVDFKRDWKLVTVMIGGNNICRHQLPRAFVNLVPVVDMSQLQRVKRDPFCQAALAVLCPCLAGGRRQDEVRALVRQYQRAALRLLETGRYDTRDDFTVVEQPFTVHGAIPTRRGVVDPAFLAVDCFHPSVWGHEYLAKMLWNSMLTPLAEKVEQGRNSSDQIKCPDPEHPFLPTRKNSPNVSSAAL
ncbi:phospholipase B1, membrane-associated-like [Pollicipes pollicipes]|uniref:phospholipase B1, membrane-associated-like n=1 Tax=Pollicipes pollicipes TaxID=41117 RepID=UPI0018854E4B|nr:phospholipase B1, membrane-associated-like [Pollicipes pollicipes]